MKFVSFRIENFRNILDSGWVAVDRDITCLVGKNESGKTAVLHALYRLNPAYHAEFHPGEHYPRWLLARDKKSGVIDQTKAVTGIFELSDDDIKAVEAHLGTGAMKSRRFEFSRGYRGTDGVVDLDSTAIMANIFTAAGASDALRRRFDRTMNLDGLRVAVAEAIDTAANDSSPAPDEELTALRAAIAAALSDAHSANERAVTLLAPRMPGFFYFSEYSILPGRIPLDALDNAQSVTYAEGLRTAQALLDAAGTTTDALRSSDFEDRTAELEVVSNELTAQVLEFWSQSEELEVKIELDHAAADTSRRSQAPTEHVATYLDLRVKDRRHGFTYNFSRRSDGFQWFFSFLAAFSAFDGKDVVVLLDEPGLTLHARAQADFLRFIEKRLAPSAQILYTAHSPYLIDTSDLDRIRVVEDAGTTGGATVSAEMPSASADTLMPLYTALGYRVTRDLLDAPRNLFVSSMTELMFCKIISIHLKAHGRTGLDDSWRMIPAGDSTELCAAAAFIGHKEGATVLTDGSITQPLLHRRIVSVAQITRFEHADIEDLFEVSDYLALYSRAFQVRLHPTQLPPGAGIIDRIARIRGSAFTDRERVADLLLRDRPKAVGRLGATTLANFEALFELINATRA
ncbi:AAA family ATPase [Nocardia brasiliensis]|uniref:AAA family ATPase n=1 Tax=Nocardia brasiliensis TaxID=37326 RepID=UPI003D8DCC23